MKKLLLFLLSTIVIFPQSKLTLTGAVEIALKNNYSIIISRSLAEIDRNNLSLGNAGFMPSLNASGSFTRSITNTSQEYLDGRQIDRDGAVTKNLNAALSLNWTIFDGFEMFADFDRLKELKRTGEINLKNTVEQNVTAVISSYYNIVREQQLLKVIKENIALSEERVRIAENKLDVGSGSRFDLRQAAVDLNADRTTFLREELKLVEEKIKLNELLGRSIDEDYQVEDSIIINKGLILEDLLLIAMEKNSELLLAMQNKSIADINLRIADANWFPFISLTAGYNYSKSEAEAGFIKQNLNNGFNYGVTASWNLFNGFNTSRIRQNAQINIDINQTALTRAEESVRAELLTAYRRYENSLRLVELETENLESTRENVDIALERLRLGTLTPLEFRETQRQLLESQSRLMQAQYEAKLAETDLLHISGTLIK